MGTLWLCDLSSLRVPSAPQNEGPCAFSVSCSWAQWPARPWTAPSPAPTPSTPTGSAAQCAEVSGTATPCPRLLGGPWLSRAPVSSAPSDCNYEGRKVVNGQVFTLDDEPCTQCMCQVSQAWELGAFCPGAAACLSSLCKPRSPFAHVSPYFSCLSSTFFNFNHLPEYLWM